ncbi:hypothetical protein CANCADRAFT_57172 [Tortispora caseinolytica NRRL Y-17796]|uniref:Uncharacterized protein n=1 Tax=Tortispora caseinolytica NRRL Y-17796 TaxID=767744 RepID=A0A1E4TG46_9ASCO|nr:hypothetical protein CANCADRAFT_57172 [Tortispora caseinolytica NRRL Y-17796]
MSSNTRATGQRSDRSIYARRRVPVEEMSFSTSLSTSSDQENSDEDVEPVDTLYTLDISTEESRAQLARRLQSQANLSSTSSLRYQAVNTSKTYEHHVKHYRKWYDEAFANEDVLTRYYPTMIHIRGYVEYRLNHPEVSGNGKRPAPKTIDGIIAALKEHTRFEKDKIESAGRQCPVLSEQEESFQATELKKLRRHFRKLAAEDMENVYELQDATSRKAYVEKELIAIVKWLCMQHGRKAYYMSIASMVLTAHSGMHPGDSVRKMNIASLSVWRGVVNNRRCDAIKVTMTASKTNKFGKTEDTLALRNLDPRRCPIAFLGYYMIERFYVVCDKPIPFADPREFIKCKLYRDYGTDKKLTEPMAFRSHFNPLKESEIQLSMTFHKVTHSSRSLAANEVIQNGASYGSVKNHGQWGTSNDTMNNNYLFGDNTETPCRLAGVVGSEKYVMIRDGVQPSLELCFKVFPFIEEWHTLIENNTLKERVKEEYRRYDLSLTNTRLLDSHVAKIKTAVELFIYLAKCVLQDRIFLEKCAPELTELPSFKSSAFLTEEYADFRKEQEIFIASGAVMPEEESSETVQGSSLSSNQIQNDQLSSILQEFLQEMREERAQRAEEKAARAKEREEDNERALQFQKFDPCITTAEIYTFNAP